MKPRLVLRPQIKAAIAEDDPLRLIEFRALLKSAQDLEIETISLTEARQTSKLVWSC
jgi:hypothetical protein